MKRLVKMLKDLIAEADTEGLKLAPFIGIACPGVINADGAIEKGAQNLPGNWESSKFNLPASLVEAIPEIGDHDTAVLMHNDGVAQGLSEVPFMQDVERWGVLTIGTGLGNARFTNRRTRTRIKRQKGQGRQERRRTRIEIVSAGRPWARRDFTRRGRAHPSEFPPCALSGPSSSPRTRPDRRAGIAPYGARRGGRVVECTALEMRHRCKPIGGSNPSLSAISLLSGPDT